MNGYAHHTVSIIIFTLSVAKHFCERWGPEGSQRNREVEDQKAQLIVQILQRYKKEERHTQQPLTCIYCSDTVVFPTASCDSSCLCMMGI